MPERKEVDVNPWKRNDPLLTPGGKKRCSHPADYLEVRAMSMDRNLIDKPISVYSEDPTDFILKKKLPGQTHYRVLCFCTKCQQEIYIYGSA